MIPDIIPHNRLELNFSISFQGTLWGHASNRLTAYYIHPIELELGWMILNLSSHNIAKLESFLSRICCGARLLKFSSRFTAYSIHPTQLKLGSVILDLSLHILQSRIFISSQKVLWRRASRKFKSIHILQFSYS